ncbi:MAG: hypothetical protein HF978_06630 [Desulfobacteraceae bacterium]|nr:hypothetical protein [Desulfobacteraceae bacterium]MBC2755207.1 hypothetical protein [Desulfobacteraceae bacterium]
MFKLIQSIMLIFMIAGVIYLGNKVLDETKGMGADHQTMAEQKNDVIKNVLELKDKASKKADEIKKLYETAKTIQENSNEMAENGNPSDMKNASFAPKTNRSGENEFEKNGLVDEEDRKLTAEIMEYDAGEGKNKGPDWVVDKMMAANDVLTEEKKSEPVDLESVGRIMGLYSKAAEALDIH